MVRDLSELFDHGPVPIRAMLDLLHEAERANLDEIAFANSLMPAAGDYLGRLRRAFVRADISDDEAKREIARNKALVQRLSNLFPAVLRYLTLGEKSYALNVLNMVYDCASDYPVILESGRKETNKKRIIDKIYDLGSKIEEMNNLLDDPYSTHPYDFEHVYQAYRKHILRDDEKVRPFWQLQNDLKFLGQFLNYNLYRAHRDPDFLRPPDNQAKTNIVDYAYSLSMWWGGPPLVTTPGSDFSAMCSLIYEIATGVADESLAGAINRYSRSQERAEADANEEEYSPARDRARDEDNFYDVKQGGVTLRSEIENLKATLRDPSLSDGIRVLVGSLLLEAIEKKERNEKAHGPFIMWASQMKIFRDDHTDHGKDLEDHRVRTLRLDIEVGNARRAERTSS